MLHAMRIPRLALALGLGLLVVGCGDNIKGGDDTGDDDPTVDAAPVDAMMIDAEPPPDAMVVCPAREAGAVGGACASDDDCDSAKGANDGFCFVGPFGPTTFPPEGYCVHDNGLGTICDDDGDCGAGNLCVDLPELPYKYCLPACGCGDVTNACPPNQACFETFNGFAMSKAACVPGSAAAVDGDPCAGFYECGESSACNEDSLEFPGGECAKFGCTLGDDSTCNGGHCAMAEPPFAGTECRDTCEVDADCREAEGYVCYDPDGSGGAARKYCRHPRIGDPCATADDCGGASWTCMTGAEFDGGMCTVVACPTAGTINGCTPGSVCHDPADSETNYCVDRCTGTEGTQGTCRAGYLCVDTNPAPPAGPPPAEQNISLGCVPDPA